MSKFGTLTRAGEKAAARRHEVAVKRATRAAVWARSDVCEYCGDTERETARTCHKRTHEADEVCPRWRTRGLAPEVRFSTANTARVCPCCHVKKTQHQLIVVFHNETEGMNGDVDITTRDGTVVHRVRRPSSSDLATIE